jgi:pimeloyl-ACP methyl ester carboxylesterase
MTKIYATFLPLLFTAALFAQSNAAVQPNTVIPYGDNAGAGHYVKLRGINMYYETYGSGEPLLIIHGNSGSIADFENQIPFFAKNYKVIVADSRDHGKTLDTLHMNDSLSYEMMSDDYAELLAQLHIDSAYVIGWSDGGINGLLLAMRHPEKVKKLAVTGANLWIDSTTVEPFIIKAFTMQYKMLKFRKPSVERTVLLRHYNLLLTQPNIKPEELKQVKCPTLVMAGDRDVIKPEHTLLIARSIPKSNLWISPNSGHGLPVMENKDKFNSEVAQFFKTPFKKIEGYGFLQH